MHLLFFDQGRCWISLITIFQKEKNDKASKTGIPLIKVLDNQWLLISLSWIWSKTPWRKMLKHNGSGGSSLQGTSAAGDSAQWLPQKWRRKHKSVSKKLKEKSNYKMSKKYQIASIYEVDNGSGRSSLQGTSAAGDLAQWFPQKLPKST